MTQATNREHKVRSYDRELVLKPIDDRPLKTSGLLDRRIFSGENQLRAIMDLQTNLWKLKYTKGIVPPIFDQRFTTFQKLLDFVVPYFKRRNIAVTEVKD